MRAAADVLVTLFDGEAIADALRLAGELRAAGLRVEVYPEPDKLGKQFKYASTPRRALRRPSSAATNAPRGMVTVKNMETGEQISVPRADAAGGSRADRALRNGELALTLTPPNLERLIDMNQPLGPLARTHTCGALTAADVGQDVVLLGWVHRVRDLGSLVFIDIRDRHGITQVVARDNEALVGAGRAAAAGVRRSRCWAMSSAGRRRR